ncbi:MAG: hypothetical protein WC373_04950 [Smithella sp.]|jgi:hypothetical protein
MSDFKICLVEPRMMHGVQHEPGEIIGQGKFINGATIEKVVSALISGKAKILEVLNEDAPEHKPEKKESKK